MSEEATEAVAEAPVTPEAPPPSAVPTQAAPQRAIASNLKSIMDRENALRQREEQLKLVPQLQSEVDQMRNLAKSNPIRFLEQHGVTLDKLEELKTQASDPTAQMRAELNALKSRIEMEDKNAAEAKKQQQLDQAKKAVDEWVNKSDRFPYVQAAGASTLVFQRMLDHYNQTGEELSEELAASEVDTEIKELARRLVPLLGDEATPAPAVTQASTTLTNQQAASGTRVADPASPEDALAAAAQLLKFT